MRALIIYSHPCDESYNAAVRDTVVRTLQQAGHETRLLDLHASGFNPVMVADERRAYHDHNINEQPVAEHIEHIRWAEMLIFVYPTWWFGLPAMLKGWIDRVWVPHVTFSLPQGKGPLEGKMTHIKRIGIITTCGATWFASKWVGEPGKKTLLSGLKYLCCPNAKTLYLAHYEMDSSTQETRSTFLNKIEKRLARF